MMREVVEAAEKNSCENLDFVFCVLFYVSHPTVLIKKNWSSQMKNFRKTKVDKWNSNPFYHLSYLPFLFSHPSLLKDEKLQEKRTKVDKGKTSEKQLKCQSRNRHMKCLLSLFYLLCHLNFFFSFLLNLSNSQNLPNQIQNLSFCSLLSIFSN